MLEAADQKKIIAAASGLIPAFAVAVMSALSNLGLRFEPWVWVTYAFVCSILMLVCIGCLLSLFGGWARRRGVTKRASRTIQAVGFAASALASFALYKWGVIWPDQAQNAVSPEWAKLQAENDVGHGRLQEKLERAARSAPVRSTGLTPPAPTGQARSSTIAPNPAPPGPIAQAVAPASAHLPRSFSFTRFEPNLATPPSGERELISYGMSFTNTGNDMLRPRVKSFSLSADGATILTAGERTMNFLARGEAQAAGINPRSGKRITLPAETKEMVAEIRLDYDTVPPTGVRHVYRKIRHIIHWPEEGRSLWMETSILDEGED